MSRVDWLSQQLTIHRHPDCKLLLSSHGQPIKRLLWTRNLVKWFDCDIVLMIAIVSYSKSFRYAVDVQWGNGGKFVVHKLKWFNFFQEPLEEMRCATSTSCKEKLFVSFIEQILLASQLQPICNSDWIFERRILRMPHYTTNCQHFERMRIHKFGYFESLCSWDYLF